MVPCVSSVLDMSITRVTANTKLQKYVELLLLANTAYKHSAIVLLVYQIQCSVQIRH